MEIKSALIVDDSQMARIVLKKQLVSQSITVHMAESGEESLKFLEQNEHLPDIIFMDCLMPGMDGFEATKKIHENPKFTNIPIVMCTGKESDDDKQKAFDLGAAGYMSKSSSSEPLQTILDEFSKQETQIILSETKLDVDKILQLFETTGIEVATAVAEKVANDVSLEKIASFTEECAKNSNDQIASITDQLEQKIIFTVRRSLEDTHSYIDEKISKTDNALLSEFKLEVNHSIEELKTELSKVDIRSTINEIVDQKVHKAIENNLSTYVTVLLEHEVAQSLIEAKIQEQLAAHNSKIESLEELVAAKPDSKPNILSIVALLLGASALAFSLYPFFK